MIQLPRTLRAPTLDEIPVDSPARKKLEELQTANIVQGYKLLDKEENEENKNSPFTFFAEINIDNSRLWDLINSLTAELPDVSSLIFGLQGSKPFYGEYLAKSELLMDLVEFKKELTEDTFIEWGLIYQDDEKLVEIFIPESKYIKYWGVNKNSFSQIMNDFGLKEVADIKFVDEYPKVREALSSLDESAIGSEELITKLKEKYT
ncbi:MAG: hypothetical protein IH946_02345 [Bacteroidetes bacterium]|nr:hypothetical protein [Bacteroidota bacterium]